MIYLHIYILKLIIYFKTNQISFTILIYPFRSYSLLFSSNQIHSIRNKIRESSNNSHKII
jgi:hypothetical protein